ncbi:MAG: hypothetical protein J5794_01975 [Lachnospiraceae bacterium]|nr:hypothetical protein [Lachnospiraceae bacterium]
MDPAKAKSKRRRILLLIAAALVLLVIPAAGLIYTTEVRRQAEYNSTIRRTEDGIRLPGNDLAFLNSISGGSGAGERGSFLVYEGKLYMRSRICPEDLLETYLGPITKEIGSVFPWTQFPDNSGNFTGEFYSVRDVDPGYMVGVKVKSGGAALYTAIYGIIVDRGADIFEEGLHLRETAVKADVTGTTAPVPSRVFSAGDPELQELIREINDAKLLMGSEIGIYSTMGEVTVTTGHGLTIPFSLVRRSLSNDYYLIPTYLSEIAIPIPNSKELFLSGR